MQRSPTFSTGRTGCIHRYCVLTDVQLGRESKAHPDAICRVGAEALDTLVLTELRRLTDRPNLDAADLLKRLKRIELRQADTHLILDRAAVIDDDHPDLALQDLEARLGPGERMVMEEGGAALRVALPLRMKLRGGRTWTAFAGAAPELQKVDSGLVDALQRAHLLCHDWKDDERSDYRRRLRRLAFLSPTIQRMILQGQTPASLSLVDMLETSPPLR